MWQVPGDGPVGISEAGRSCDFSDTKAPRGSRTLQGGARGDPRPALWASQRPSRADWGQRSVGTLGCPQTPP